MTCPPANPLGAYKFAFTGSACTHLRFLRKKHEQCEGHQHANTDERQSVVHTAGSLIDETNRRWTHKAAEAPNGIDQGEAGRHSGAGKKLARNGPKRAQKATETELHQ